jgi:hypothetical protein
LNYWHAYEGFNYYAQDNYKGKLLMSVELEEIDDFSLQRVVTEGNLVYPAQTNVHFYINYENTSE